MKVSKVSNVSAFAMVLGCILTLGVIAAAVGCV
jgi:hypothetical protein